MGGARGRGPPPGQIISSCWPSSLNPTSPTLTQAAPATGAPSPGKAVAAQPGMAQAPPQGQSGCGFSGAPGSEAEPAAAAEQMTARLISPIAAGSKMALKTGSSVLRTTA